MPPKYELSVGGVSVEAVFNKLGGPEGAKRLLSGELAVSEKKRRWRIDKNGWIRFSFFSTGTPNWGWPNWFHENGYNVDNVAASMLHESPVMVTPRGTTYEVVILPGRLWEDEGRTLRNIRRYCDWHNLIYGKDQSAEIICWVRRIFPNDEIGAMGLKSIFGLHEPIKIARFSRPHFIGVSSRGAGGGFIVGEDSPDYQWGIDDGFAVLVPPVSPQVLES